MKNKNTLSNRELIPYQTKNYTLSHTGLIGYRILSYLILFNLILFNIYLSPAAGREKYVFLSFIKFF